MHEVTKHPLRKREILIEELRPLRFARLLLNFLPEVRKVGHVRAELFFRRAFLSARAHNVAAFFFRGTKCSHFFPKPFAKRFVIDALRDADVRVVRQINKLSASERNRCREPRALRSDRVLRDLHHQALPLMKKRFDRAKRSGFGARPFNLCNMKESRALKPNIQKGALHARKHADYLTVIDVSYEAPCAHALNEDVLQDAVL